MKSISKRLNVIFVGMVTLVLIGSGALNYYSAKVDLDQRLQEQGTALSTRLKFSVPALLWNFDEKQIDKTLEAEMIEADILGILIRTKDGVASGRLRTADGKIQPAAKDAKLTEPFQSVPLEFIDNGTAKPVGHIEFTVSTERRDAALRSLIIKLAAQIIVLNILLVLTLSISLRTLVFRPLSRISHALQQIASGEADLTKRLDVGERNEIGEVAHWFNTFVGRLQEIVSHVIESTNGLAQAEKTMSLGIEQSAQRANEQSEIITSMAAAMEEMTVGISHVSDQSAEVHTVSEQSGTLARGGSAAVNELIGEMRRIADSVNPSSETIEALGKESEKISSVVKVIKDIADQTNLLALNAAILAPASRGAALRWSPTKCANSPSGRPNRPARSAASSVSYRVAFMKRSAVCTAGSLRWLTAAYALTKPAIPSISSISPRARSLSRSAIFPWPSPNRAVPAPRSPAVWNRLLS